MLLPGRVDLSAGLLLPRHLSGDPIIESKKNRQKSGKNERNSRAVSPVSPIEAVSTAYRENAEWVPSRSSQDIWRSWRIQVPMRNNHSFSCRFRVAIQSTWPYRTHRTRVGDVSRYLLSSPLSLGSCCALAEISRFTSTCTHYDLLIFTKYSTYLQVFQTKLWAVRVFAVTSCG